MRLYLYNILIAIDQFVNVLIGGAPDQTISGRCWQHKDHWAGAMAVRFVDWLFSLYETEHCRKSFESDRHDKAVWG